jgi:hypothetical protein
MPRRQIPKYEEIKYLDGMLHNMAQQGGNQNYGYSLNHPPHDGGGARTVKSILDLIK